MHILYHLPQISRFVSNCIHFASINEEYSDPPRLTEKIIINAQEEAIHDDGQSLFHIHILQKCEHDQ